MLIMTRHKLIDIKAEAEQRATERAEFVAHRDDCIAYRRTTEGRFDNIDVTLEAGRKARDDQHKQNVATLRWQLALTIGILLSIAGFIIHQAWPRIFHS